jgi:glyoxalase/bleomycin resistance protein/dioxygenase superfamily protein
VLGLTELPKPAALQARGGAWFRGGDCELHVGIDDPFAPARKAHPGLRVGSAADLHALADRLAAAGCPVTWADDIPGRLRLHTADPFGNRLELLV